MFNIGPGELVAILAVALIVLGPNRLPDAVRTVGRVVGELRRISGGFQDELRNAFDDSDVIDQLEKGPQAEPAKAKDDPPVVDETGTLPEDAVPTVDETGTLAESARVDDDLDDDFDEIDGVGVVDTSALGLGPSAPTELVDGNEETREDPPETDQRAAS